MKIKTERKYFHWAFEVSVLLKGIDGLLEVLGGLLLIFIPTAVINRSLFRITQVELAEDPSDIIANAIFHLSQTLSTSMKVFGAVYLISHGVIKIGLVIALLKKKLWAYPASICFLIIFILYQLYRLQVNFTISMLLLTVLDFIVIVLIWHEYSIVKNHLQIQNSKI